MVRRNDQLLYQPPQRLTLRRVRWWGAIALVIALVHHHAAADSLWPTPVSRSSIDRNADLIAQLQRSGRFQEAAQICKSRLANLPRDSDEAAKWTIWLSQTLSIEQMAKNEFGDLGIDAAEKPILDLLGGYPDHPRRLFLEAQKRRVRRDAAKHAVVTTSVSPSSDQRRDQAMTRVARATGGLLSLAKEVREAESQLGSARSGRRFAMIEDLVRLEQELQVDAVSLSLLQTELFPPGSQDLLSAATSAEAAAKDAESSLPASSLARREVQRLRIEAIIRGGQFQHGEAELARFARELPKPIPANVLAMQIRIDMARDRLPAAESRLDSYYGATPETAPRSIEMDLARLDYLLARGGGNGQVGKWLDMIERRSGLYARRRAEAISLARFRSGDSTSTIDASLVAAQAQDWVLRGDLARAGELFSAAALAESDETRAIRHATQAAAAFIKSDRIGDAAEVLARVALKNPSAEAAPAAHLQAAVTYSQSKLPDAATRIEALLTTHLNIWPAGERAAAARAWLVKILSSQNRHTEAAAAATLLPESQIAAADLKRAVDLWRIACLAAKNESEQTAIELKFQESFRPLIRQPIAAAHYRSAASYLLGRQSLDNLPDRSSIDENPEDTFCDQLLAYRLAKGVSTLAPPPDSLRQITSWRLMNDARKFPGMRASVAAAINGWSADEQSPSLEQAERLIWRGQVPGAVKVLRKLVADTSRSGAMMREAATLLGTSDNASAKSEAIKMWDELAAGIPQGSTAWHEAKLRAIDLLAQTGHREESRRRAKYILLTAAPQQSDLKQRYQSAAK